MGQDKVVVRLEQRELIPQAIFALTQRIDPASHRRHALADIKVEPFDKSGIDRPAACRQDLLDGQLRAEHHTVFDLDDAPASHRLHNLRIEESGQRHPSWLRSWPFALAPFGLNPMTEMRQDRRFVLVEPVRQKKWHTARRQYLGDLMQDALRHR